MRKPTWIIYGDFDDCPYSIRAKRFLEERGQDVRCVPTPIGDRSPDTPYAIFCSKFNHRQGRVPLILRKLGEDLEFVGGFTELTARPFG
jgi:hypothetical protein